MLDDALLLLRTTHLASLNQGAILPFSGGAEWEDRSFDHS
jgi:hypothetical protein